MRIGVNIPNELMRRLKPLKPGLNVSQVCRDALEAEVRNYENMRARLDDDDIQEAVSRITRREQEFRAVLDVNWEKLGYEDAADWVKVAEWHDWERLHHGREIRRKDDRQTWEWQPHSGKVKDFDDRYREFFGRINQQSDDFLDWYEELGGFDLRSAEQEYGNAWHAYTEAVWELICQKKEEYREARRKERLAERENRPAPEVPPHLLSEPQPLGVKPRFRVIPNHGGLAPGVTPENLKQIHADLEMAELLAKLERSQ